MRGNGEGQRVVAVEERKEVGHGDIVSSHEYFSSRDRTACPAFKRLCFQPPSCVNASPLINMLEHVAPPFQ